MADRDDVTAFSLYSSQAGAFDDSARAIAAVLAKPSARTLAVATQRDRVAHLRRALASNREIGAATGILMATRRLTRDDAFELLRHISQHTNVKLADLATQVLDTGVLETWRADIDKRAGARV